MVSAEQSVIGSMLIDEKCIPQVLSELRAGDFRDTACKAIFVAIQALYSDGRAVDPVTTLNKLGGTESSFYELIQAVLQTTPTAANVGEYTKIVKTEAKLRRLREAGEKLSTTQDIETALELVGGLVDEAQENEGRSKEVSLQNSVLDFYNRINEKPSYKRFFIPGLDEHLFVRSGDFIVLGGYPSDGKTALALQMAYSLSEREKIGFFSLETSTETLTDRLIAHAAQIPLEQINKRDFSEKNYEELAAAVVQVDKRKLDLIQASGMTAGEIIQRSRAKGYRSIFVDYLQIIRPNKKAGTRENEVAEISRVLHTGAQQNGITIVALSQLSRPEKTQNTRTAKEANGPKRMYEPGMRDLRESGQIEQDADCILLLSREDDSQTSRRILRTVKNKQGELRKTYFYFNGKMQTFKKDTDQKPKIY